MNEFGTSEIGHEVFGYCRELFNGTYVDSQTGLKIEVRNEYPVRTIINLKWRPHVRFWIPPTGVFQSEQPTRFEQLVYEYGTKEASHIFQIKNIQSAFDGESDDLQIYFNPKDTRKEFPPYTQTMQTFLNNVHQALRRGRRFYPKMRQLCQQGESKFLNEGLRDSSN